MNTVRNKIQDYVLSRDQLILTQDNVESIKKDVVNIINDHVLLITGQPPANEICISMLVLEGGQICPENIYTMIVMYSDTIPLFPLPNFGDFYIESEKVWYKFYGHNDNKIRL